MMVTAGVFLVKKIYKLGDWDDELKELSGLTENNVKFCARDIYQSVQKVEGSQFTSVRRKYASTKYCEVSKFKIEQGRKTG